MEIEFGEYLPDIPSWKNPGLITAQNVLPYAQSYRPFPNSQIYSGATSQRVQGFISIVNNAGTSFNYCGDISALYSLSGTSWTDVTDPSATYQTDTAEAWEFAQWGNLIIATNYANNMQVITAGASNFVSLAGTPPKARHIAVVRNFLVTGNVTEQTGGAANPTRVHWCGYDNITTWTAAASTQADFNPLYADGGWIQKVVGGEYGVIFQERAIWRMTYVGSPLVFQFDQVEIGKGTLSSGSIIKAGYFIFYLGHDDFYMFNGSISLPIGSGKIYETFKDNFDSTYDYRISAAIDPIRTIVAWAYPGVGNNNGNPNKILLYNWSASRWAIADLEVEILCNIRQPGYTLDQLDTINTNIELLSASLDSRIWMGGTINFAAFSNQHRLITFTGSPMQARLETGDRYIGNGKRALITNIRPLIDSTTVSLSIGSKNLLSASSSYSQAVSINSDGLCPVMAEGRYHRIRMDISGTYTQATGVEIDISETGEY